SPISRPAINDRVGRVLVELRVMSTSPPLRLAALQEELDQRQSKGQHAEQAEDDADDSTNGPVALLTMFLLCLAPFGPSCPDLLQSPDVSFDPLQLAVESLFVLFQSLAVHEPCSLRLHLAGQVVVLRVVSELALLGLG